MSLLNKKVLRHVNLGSSSEGNCYYLELALDNGEIFKMFIECGFAYQELLKKCIEFNIDINEINAVLVTHEHFDHSRAVLDLHKRGYKIYAPQTVFDRHKINIDKKQVFEKEFKNKLIYDNIKVLGFPLEHNDEHGSIYNLGYIITIDDNFKILFVIDTKYIDFDLTDYKFNMIYIESNHIRARLSHAVTQAKQSGDVIRLRRYNRLYNSHMSIENTCKILFGYKNKRGEYIKGLNLKDTELIILTHLTSDKTTKPLYYKQVAEIYKKQVKTNAIVLVARRTGGYV